MRVLVFGASTTQGFWDTEGGWVARLRKYYDTLHVKDFKSDQPVIFNLGISADTSKNVLNRFIHETEARKRHGDLAFIFSVGTNNAAEGTGFIFDPDEYEKDLHELIQRAKKYSTKILLVGLPSCDEKLTTPVSWNNVYYTNKYIKAIEGRIQKVAAAHSLPAVFLFEEFKKRQNAGEELLYDGLHPNNAGHELIASMVKPKLQEVLENHE